MYNDFEERRKANIADNKRILAEIGLINPFKNQPLNLKKTTFKRKADKDYVPLQNKRWKGDENDDFLQNSKVMVTRRSARIHRESKGELSEVDGNKGSVFLTLDDVEKPAKTYVPKNRPNYFGAVPGIEVGEAWLTRMECSRDGVHRPTVAGIHGGTEGAYSIALSGRYDDNVDYGNCFTYTGEGGRDLKGTKSNPKNLREAPQTKDQELSRGNFALKTSVDTGNPVRVIRGYQLKNAFSPEEGYRYDGLYTVKKAWYSVGMSGFQVWRFALQRCEGQAPPPWEMEAEEENDEPKASS